MTTQRELAYLFRDDADPESPGLVDDGEEMKHDRHFIVVMIGSGKGFKPILKNKIMEQIETGRREDMHVMKDAMKQMLRPHSDPFIKVMIDNDPNMTTRTHIYWNCNDGRVRFKQYRRIYINPQKLPQNIHISAYDKSDEPGFDDAEYGTFIIDCAREAIFGKTGKIWHKICDLNDC